LTTTCTSNALGLDVHNITWPRVLDVNDRALRNIVIGLGSRIDGVPRQSRFDITAASEVMAILALSTSLADLRQRLGAHCRRVHQCRAAR
jgi:formate--tetrahydrofolate ligase